MKPLRGVASAIAAAVAIGALSPVRAEPIKNIRISTDFDGSGSGSIYSVNVDTGHRSGGSSPTTSQSPPCCATSDSAPPSTQFLEQIRDYEIARQEEQRRIDALRLAAEAAHRANQADRALRAIDELNRMLRVEADSKRRYHLRYQIDELISQFNSQQTQYRLARKAGLQSLRSSIDQIVVPPPAVTHFGTVMLFGDGVTPVEAAAAQKSQITDPFDAKPYDRVFAFGRPGFFNDLPRSMLDHLLANFDSLSPQVMGRIGPLRGATIDRLVAHSNGGLVAEVLIRTGFIHVRRLDLLGGDGALMSLDELSQLHDRTGVEIHVYATKDDPVPLLPIGWKIRELSERLRESLPSLRHSTDPTDVVLGLIRPTDGAQSGVYVHLLSTPYTGERVVENHQYNTYYAIIRAQQLLSGR